MTKERLSGGSAIAAQLMIIVVWSTITLGAMYFFLAGQLTIERVMVLTVIVCLFLGLLYSVFKYADIYLANGYLTQEKLFGSRVTSITAIKNVDRAIMPMSYVITFVDGRKVFFFTKNDELLKQAVGGSNNYLNGLKQKLQKPTKPG